MSDKYLIVLGHFAHMGGAERQAIHFIDYLLGLKGVEVAVLGWSKPGVLSEMLEEKGCEIHHFPMKLIEKKFKQMVNLMRLSLYIRKKIAPDYILPFVSVNSKPVCQIWQYTGAKFTWWNQQDEGRYLNGTSGEKRALLNASLITSNSVAGSDYIAETYGISKDRILTYNNGTILPDKGNLPVMWREKLNLSDSTMLVSMIANIIPYKDHETLLRAWKIVIDRFAANGREIPLLALAGLTNRRHHVTKMKLLAFDLELGTSVKFLGAIDSTNELIAESDLVVHSSLTEGCPNAVCEAMALGLPVVGTDIPGMRQALGEELSEICLCEEKNHETLGNKIVEFLENKELSSKIGAQGRTRIENDFSIEGMCETLMSAIHKDSGEMAVVK